MVLKRNPLRDDDNYVKLKIDIPVTDEAEIPANCRLEDFLPFRTKMTDMKKIVQKGDKKITKIFETKLRRN